jgi:uncharacterized RDD family membrane protein YckC
MDGAGAGGELGLVFGPYAGFWRRFWAALLDVFILSLIGIVVTHVFGVNPLKFSVFTQPIGRVGDIGRTRLAGIATGWLYFAILESSPAQATVGKMLLHIGVTRVDGSRASFLRATVRYFAKYLSALIFMIGFLMAAVTRHKQALHDMIADCVVVKRSQLR